MRDRTGENQVYVRQQKAAEEQKRFGKGLALSCTPSRSFAAAAYHEENPHREKPQDAPQAGNANLPIGVIQKRNRHPTNRHSGEWRSQDTQAAVFAAKLFLDCRGAACCARLGWISSRTILERRRSRAFLISCVKILLEMPTRISNLGRTRENIVQSLRSRRIDSACAPSKQGANESTLPLKPPNPSSLVARATGSISDHEVVSDSRDVETQIPTEILLAGSLAVVTPSCAVHRSAISPHRLRSNPD